jgi:hypothetical protein
MWIRGEREREKEMTSYTRNFIDTIIKIEVV